MITMVRLNEKEITLRQLLDTEADLHLGKSPLNDVDDDVKQLIRERWRMYIVCSVTKKHHLIIVCVLLTYGVIQ